MRGRFGFVLAFTLSIVLLWVWIAGVLRPVETAVHPAPTLIVLGAAQYNGRPSPLFKARLDHALALYQSGGVRKIIVSGGIAPGDRWSEGRVGQLYLIGRGIPEARVVAESNSHSTVENLENTQLLLSPGTPVTLVTDEIHAPRALSVAKDLGLDATVSPSRLSQDTPYLRQYRLREQVLRVIQKILGRALF